MNSPTGQDLSTTQTSAVSTDVLDMSELAALAGQGNSNVGAADLQTQFLAIIESNAEALKPSKGGYVKGAVQGEILKSVSRTTIDGTKGFYAIPCYYSKECVEWSPANKIVGRHSLASPEYLQAAKENLRNAQNRLTNRAGNSMTDTRYHALLLVDPTTLRTERAVVTMATTRIKASSRLNKQIQDVDVPTGNPDGSTFNPPRFGQLYKFITVGDNDGKGHDYYNWMTTFVSPVGSRTILAEAQKFHDECAAQGSVLSTGLAQAMENERGSGNAGDDDNGDANEDKPF